MPDFMATYGINDAEVAAGFRRIEAQATRHGQAMERQGNAFDTLYGQARQRILGIDQLVKSAFTAGGSSIGLATRALSDYARQNSFAAAEVERFHAANRGLWNDIGRDISGLTSIFDGAVSKLRYVRDEIVDVAASLMSGLFGESQTNEDIKAQTAARKEQEAMDLVLQARRRRDELEAERLSRVQGATARMAAVQARAALEEKRGLEEIAELRTKLEKAGRKDEADRLARSVRLSAQQSVLAERERQAVDDITGREAVRQRIETAAQERQLAREGFAELAEGNAMRIFGLEASQRQLQVAEAQLRYDKQLRDLAADKALLEEDRARASALILEQRDAELGLLRAFRGGAGPGRGIALGSSVNPLQVFAKGKDDEKADRREAQRKFDKMIGELRSIRENTAKAQRATYQ